MTEQDLAAVMAVEQASYRHPWKAQHVIDCLSLGHPAWVVLQDQHIIGHGLLRLVADEAELLNLAIAPPHQGRGLGRQLLRYLKAAAAKRAQMMFLEVRVSNVQAIALYYDEGFFEVGQRRDYYPSQWGREDALVLACDLSV